MSFPGVALGLRARTRALEGPIDLLEHLGDHGCAWLDGDHGFVTAGVAATVAPEHAVALLATIDHDLDRDAPRSAGPRAVGALPFTGDGRLVIPARIIGRDVDGRTWCTTLDEDTPPRLDLAAAAPTRFTVEAQSTSGDWNDAVAAALTAIHRGELQKVVLARAVAVDADRDFDVRTVLRRLVRNQPGCVVYADGGFVGASPELLVDRRGEHVTCRPLAGTGANANELLASAKDAWEHQLVVDAVSAALQTCAEVVHADRPAPAAFADITHLATTVTATATSSTVIDLVHALHPTPAVAGTPVDIALDLIARLESIPRNRYAGPCGWVDARGDGAFVVALRGADISGAHALLHAGAGIVAGSDSEAEWAETQAKLRPMLTALVAP
jgi:menaquinone-specific isochorismate synthase